MSLHIFAFSDVRLMLVMAQKNSQQLGYLPLERCTMKQMARIMGSGGLNM
jgi:hypothetical protein